MESITLKYASGTYSLTLNVLSVKGFDEYEEVEYHNAKQAVSDDGVIYEQMDAFRRIISVDFGVVQSSVSRAFIVAWLNDYGTRTMTFGGVEKSLALFNPGGWSSEWKLNVKFMKAFTLKFKERSTSAVTATGGATPQPVVEVGVYRSGIATLSAKTETTVTFTVSGVVTALPSVPIIPLRLGYNANGDGVGVSVYNISASGFKCISDEPCSFPYLAFVTT